MSGPDSYVRRIQSKNSFAPARSLVCPFPIKRTISGLVNRETRNSKSLSLYGRSKSRSVSIPNISPPFFSKKVCQAMIRACPNQGRNGIQPALVCMPRGITDSVCFVVNVNGHSCSHLPLDKLQPIPKRIESVEATHVRQRIFRRRVTVRLQLLSQVLYTCY